VRIGIVGCGLIGRRRAAVIKALSHDELVIVADVVEARARTMAAEMGCKATTDWRDVVTRDDVDGVVVSTTNNWLAPITVAALQGGKHVLCEKPLGRNAQEAKKIVTAAQAHNRVLKAGFNHRHHPGVWRAHELAQGGAIGPLMSIRAAYGHGGRPGYDQEWRGDPDLAGGGELLDQGVHIVDLCRWFLGEITQVSGMVGTWFWNVAPLEDNGLALLRTADGQIATLHTSWTQWKNLFRLEIFGRDGYLIVEGLGGSYGLERLTLGHRRPESGPPDEQTWEYPEPDVSWQAEWQEFTSAIREQRQPLGNGHDGYQAARVIDAIYESARTGRVVRLEDGEWRVEGGEMKG
jgi:predicted dehydrogenase